MFSPKIQKLIELFSKFPTVGPRTASRFVFYLLSTPKEKIEELTKSITELKEDIKICPLCFNVFEPESAESKEKELCPICSDPKRDRSTICIVEKETDLEAIEKIKKYKGFYFVLGGIVSGLSSEKLKKEIEEKIEKLIERIKKPDSEIKEVILALNPTVEGENTSLWLQRKFKNLSIKISQLGRGLPVGGELEYADEETLSSALESRR